MATYKFLVQLIFIILSAFVLSTQCESATPYPAAGYQPKVRFEYPRQPKVYFFPTTTTTTKTTTSTVSPPPTTNLNDIDINIETLAEEDNLTTSNVTTVSVSEDVDVVDEDESFNEQPALHFEPPSLNVPVNFANDINELHEPNTIYGAPPTNVHKSAEVQQLNNVNDKDKLILTLNGLSEPLKLGRLIYVPHDGSNVRQVYFST